MCSGKTSIAKCSVTTLKKLSITLEMSIEDCMNLEVEQKNTDLDGKPSDRAYLELGLSSHLTKSISEYIACHIFTLLGFTVQETMLGTYIDKKETEKIVVNL